MKDRVAEHSIDTIFIKRHSARAMSGEKITHDELMSLFEAARWAPSSYNNQPWQLVYAVRETPAWDNFFNVLVPANQSWAVNGAVLIMVASRNNFEFNNKPSRTHSFDTGAAMENLALQGSLMGLVVHGMEGFDYDKARQVAHLPDDYTVEAMFVVGRPGNITNLPIDLQTREELSDRKKIEEFIFEGIFNK
ncbi:MAG: nitroreductase family protein [Candidatus Babeliaceae bacterium]